jgi:hypothetical protein
MPEIASHQIPTQLTTLPLLDKEVHSSGVNRLSRKNYLEIRHGGEAQNKRLLRSKVLREAERTAAGGERAVYLYALADNVRRRGAQGRKLAKTYEAMAAAAGEGGV